MEDIADIESKNIYSLAGRLGFPKSHRWKMIQRTGRDNARTPMQWSAALHAGFTSGPAAWIKINSNHTRINMEAQQTDNRSILAFYKQLLDLRKNTPVLREGSFREVKISKQLFVFERTLESSNAENVPAGEKITSVIVLINLGKKPVRFPCQGKILLSNLDRISYDGTLAPYQGVLIQPV
jgi:oligo-1,6-glucosidase